MGFLTVSFQHIMRKLSTVFVKINIRSDNVLYYVTWSTASFNIGKFQIPLNRTNQINRLTGLQVVAIEIPDKVYTT